ncbi:MAG TPA: GAF and ANTAR domain-containing protein [Frankiaceae bacterium]|nr:GAF and ANTAR domain-containing protein [Frankiaceae bacterium]
MTTAEPSADVTVEPVDPTTLLLLLDERESVQDALDRLVKSCRSALPVCDDASVTLVRDDGPRTAAATSERAFQIDQWEYEHMLGPCIDALRDGEEHYVATPADTATYGDFGTVIAEVGISSVLGIPLSAGGETVGALNVYAGVERAFDDDASRELARYVALQAATTLHNVRIYDATRTLAQQLEQAMASRATIEQAKGVLAAQAGVSPDDAFTLLRNASQRENVKLREIAERIVASVARGQ